MKDTKKEPCFLCKFLPAIFVFFFIVEFLISLSYAYPCPNSKIIADGVVRKYSVDGVVFYYVKPGSSISAEPTMCQNAIHTCGNTATSYETVYNYYSLTDCEPRVNIFNVKKFKISERLTKDNFEKIIVDEINTRNNIDINNFSIKFGVKDYVILSKKYSWYDIYSDPETLCYKDGNYNSAITLLGCESIQENLRIVCGYVGVLERFMYESVYNYFQNELNNSDTCYTKEEKMSDTITRKSTICDKYKFKDILTSSSAEIVYRYLVISDIKTTIINETNNNIEKIMEDHKESELLIRVNFENIFQNVTNNYLSIETKTYTCIKVGDNCISVTKQGNEKYYIPKTYGKFLSFYVFSSYPAIVIIEEDKDIFEKILDFIKNNFNFINRLKLI